MKEGKLEWPHLA